MQEFLLQHFMISTHQLSFVQVRPGLCISAVAVQEPLQLCRSLLQFA